MKVKVIGLWLLNRLCQQMPELTFSTWSFRRKRFTGRLWNWQFEKQTCKVEVSINPLTTVWSYILMPPLQFLMQSLTFFLRSTLEPFWRQFNIFSALFLQAWIARESFLRALWIQSNLFKTLYTPKSFHRLFDLSNYYEMAHSLRERFGM